MQPHPMTSVMQLAITAAALCVATATITFAVVTMRAERNAALVNIGVAVLRADPEKEPQARAAREWALNLIDANAGGVKFSAAVRAELLDRPIGGSFADDFYMSSFIPGKPAPKP
jgi:hypothetical protein